MFEPEENGTIEPEAAPEAPQKADAESTRIDGEYHYNKDGYSQRIYADAHYEPAGESTVPPRYYTPPEKTTKTVKVKQVKKKKGIGLFPAICLCLVCALLGGALTGGFMSSRMDARIAALEENVSANAKAIEEVNTNVQTVPAATAVVTTGAALDPSAIYAQSLQQVVGITTEVTYRNYFGQTSSSAVSGSGFIISANGYILTNYHVIEYAYEDKLDITVMTHDGTKYLASIVGVEQSNDVAVLKIDADNLKAVTFGNSDAISVGETVYAVGNPLGELEFSMSTGHVSALDRVISTEESESINMFQVDAAVNPGNSGGPLYNAQGQVIGIVTAKYSDTGVEGLGFAIPINDAASIANDLITKGYVTGKAYMGIRLDERYNSMYAQYYNMPLGAYVYSVDGGTCAETAGLQSGDIITMLDDTAIDSYTVLKQTLRQYSAGDTAVLTVYSAGEELKLNITFDEAKPSSVSDSPTEIEPAVG
ncbi:MAG: trypsin-like peptidase domain-containing protein [Oscillospiraceae bacterium]|nr:trypsin-like peptidase domain-containing protein [Oscillospiraceae bacterium]